MRWRRLSDSLAARWMGGMISLTNLVTWLIAVGLLLKAWPILRETPVGELLFSTQWRPLRGQFGFLAFIVGTAEVTLIAMVFAVPLCLLSAVYLSEYASARIRAGMQLIMDILAGVPSVVFGVWGILVVVPAVRALGEAVGQPPPGYSLLAGGVILAIMVIPVIISVSLEVLRSVPMAAREASLALGATRWETIRHVLARSCLRGLVASVVLGFTRALGETMAVLMVVGNVAVIPTSLFSPAYPLPALIANNYGEMMSIPRYDAALMLAALILMVVVAGFNLMAHLALHRFERRVR